MKKSMCKALIAVCVCMLSCGVAKAQFSLGSLGNILNSSTVDKVVDVVSGVAGIENSPNIADLEGTWTYASPACKFESNDLLKSAGGEVIASTLETKLATYYTKAGITPSRVSITFVDSTFTLKYGKMSLGGSLAKDEESGKFVVTFSALKGAIPVIVVDAVINKINNNLEMLFDVERFVQILTTAASKTQNQTLNSVVNLLNGYEGVLMGFKMTR